MIVTVAAALFIGLIAIGLLRMIGEAIGGGLDQIVEKSAAARRARAYREALEAEILAPLETLKKRMASLRKHEWYHDARETRQNGLEADRLFGVIALRQLFAEDPQSVSPALRCAYRQQYDFLKQTVNTRRPPPSQTGAP